LTDFTSTDWADLIRYADKDTLCLPIFKKNSIYSTVPSPEKSTKEPSPGEEISKEPSPGEEISKEPSPVEPSANSLLLDMLSDNLYRYDAKTLSIDSSKGLFVCIYMNI
jgi:hypothetical protein